MNENTKTKFVIYSHGNHFLPVAMKMEAPFVWADMTGMECEPDESKPIDLNVKIPSKIPNKEWEGYFDAQKEQRRQLEGKGLFEKYPAKEVTEKLLKLTDDEKKNIIIVFDFNHGTDYGEKLLKAGFRGIFAQEWAFDLERKREKAGELVKKYYKEVGVPRQVKFGTNSADKIIQFLQKENASVWVVKPNGEGLWVYCPLSEDGSVAAEQDINHIEANKEAINAIPMILQEKIIGVEINIETDYAAGKPIFAMVDLENKFGHPEELGHQTGCAFDLCFPVPLNCELRRLCNEPFDKLAEKFNFTGLMDMNAIISNKDGKPYFIEFCPNRFGYNALFVEMEIYGKSPDKYLSDLVNGKLKMPMGTFGASLRIFNEDQHQDYVSSIFNPDYENVEVQLNTPNTDGLWFFDVFKKKGKLLLAHLSEDALVVTAKSDTPEGAIEKAKLKAERDISFDGKYFRSDCDEYDRSYNPVERYKFLRDKKLLGDKNDSRRNS